MIVKNTVAVQCQFQLPRFRYTEEERDGTDAAALSLVDSRFRAAFHASDEVIRAFAFTIVSFLRNYIRDRVYRDKDGPACIVKCNLLKTAESYKAEFEKHESTFTVSVIQVDVQSKAATAAKAYKEMKCDILIVVEKLTVGFHHPRTCLLVRTGSSNHLWEFTSNPTLYRSGDYISDDRVRPLGPVQRTR
jgi:hypothetical protein